MREQEKLLKEMEMQERGDLIFEPETDFSDRWEAVVEDMLFGRHPSQTTDTDNKST